ncbi:gamma-glutamylcyclotransferase family protein [Marinobacterium arenosum]|uniref:gamma-glutamylcyclotransferase family protein n=1 Tax=Marinobacterium arenosum TaxID=2862496 RepID=UPI001C942A08|nr:gamma-glutamylcyclotransferase family protein [Marinobacterium arenosum]MBY4678957.1 gamma-glutamylcyclotransferase [Marinobacterium arenosum]
MHKIFVFGTLQQGYPNFASNRGRRIGGSFHTRERLPLYLVGERHSPWLIDQPGVGFQVHGQLFRVDAPALQAMDLLERIDQPDGYRRKMIEVVDPSSGSVEAVFAYLKPAGQLDPVQIQLGPLSRYELGHAALYRSRANPKKAK